jgi:hypothetical protein
MNRPEPPAGLNFAPLKRICDMAGGCRKPSVDIRNSFRPLTMDPRPAKPDFLYVGPPKSGSSWLAKILAEHPAVFVPPAKDIKYFDSQFHRPFSWYQGFFRGRGDALAAGEVCHNYFEHPHAAERIRARLPDVKLIFILRDPLERARSHWLLERAFGTDGGADFAAFCRRPDIRAINDYAANMSRYYERFPASQILVFFFGELRRDPAGLARALFEFLDVDPGFVPPSLYRRVLPARAARSPLLSAAAWHTAQWLRDRGGANLVGWLKQRDFLHPLLFRPLGKSPAIPLADQEAFFEDHRRMYPALTRLLGRELPVLWHTPPSARIKADDAPLEGRVESAT